MVPGNISLLFLQPRFPSSSSAYVFFCFCYLSHQLGPTCQPHTKVAEKKATLLCSLTASSAFLHKPNATLSADLKHCIQCSMTVQQLHSHTPLTSFPTLILTPLAWAPLIQLTTVQITLICSIQQELINLQKESTNSIYFSLPTHSRIRSSVSTQTLLDPPGISMSHQKLSQPQLRPLHHHGP